MRKILFFIILFLLISITSSRGYKVELPNSTIHQHITNQSQDIWSVYEIKKHLNSSLQASNNNEKFDINDNTINGSSEEDYQLLPRNHFWQSDNLALNRGVATYDDGILFFGSSYKRALDLWTHQVIPLYLKGNINESYYWLGRTAHLLEDAGQPSHVHNDAHPGHSLPFGICLGSNPDCTDSFLEEFTAQQNHFTDTQNKMNVEHYKGIYYQNKTYLYENLINQLNWSSVEPTTVSDKQNIELFRLFWYTAQKTQYYASDGEDGNSVYVILNGTQINFSPSLWQNDDVYLQERASDFNNEDYYWSQTNTSCTLAFTVQNCQDQSLTYPCYLCNINYGPHIENESNAVVPHSMKAVAGLYRLFLDAVRIDWPTESHDNQRTGFTLLKGDLVNSSSLQTDSFITTINISQDTVLRPVVADIDNDGFMNIISVNHDAYVEPIGVMYDVETEISKFLGFTISDKPKKNWNYTLGEAILQSPSLGNIDNDIQKEIIVALRNGSIFAFDINSDGTTITKKWDFTSNLKFSQEANASRRRLGGGTAIEDINLDGINDVVFTDDGSLNGWPGEVYVLNGTIGNQFASGVIGDSGGFGDVSVANIDDYLYSGGFEL